MNYTRLLLICLSVGGAVISARSEDASDESAKPNIILMFADDQAKESMGYTGVGA